MDNQGAEVLKNSTPWLFPFDPIRFSQNVLETNSYSF